MRALVGLMVMGCVGGPEWEVVADQVDGGMMLGAATLGDEVVIAGGNQNGSLWRYDGDELCVEQDVTEGNPLWWVHGRSEADWHAVGDQGTVLHSVSGTISREDLPTAATLYGVYDDGTDVWAVGGHPFAKKPTGEIWRKAGGGDWAMVTTTPAVAFKVHEGWVVGNGFALWWDGAAFVDRTPPGAPNLLTVRARAADDVWAVGGVVNPVLVHWNGTEWSEPAIDPSCVNQALNGVYTEPGDDVWIAGFNGTAASLSGDAWSCAEFPITNEHFHAVWRFGEEVLALGGNFFASNPADRYGTLARYGTGEVASFVGDCP